MSVSLIPTTWTPSEYAAWWGAIIATLALAWNILRALRSGPRIKVHAKPDMQFLPRQPLTGDKLYVCVTAINRGDAATTITHFAGFHEKTLSDLLLRVLLRRRQGFVIAPGPAPGADPVPYVLKPGEEWSGVAEQADLQKHYQGGYLYIGIIHNQRKRPVYARVHLPPNPRPSKPNEPQPHKPRIQEIPPGRYPSSSPKF